MHSHQWRNQLITEILGEDYLTIMVTGLSLTETFPTNHLETFTQEALETSAEETIEERSRCTVELQMKLDRGGDPSPSSQTTLEGHGVGVIDAAFEAIASSLEDDYPSLRSIQFTRFEIKGEVKSSLRSGAEAPCQAKLVVQNSDQLPFSFEAVGRSTISVSLSVVAQAIEHFVNAEIAFTRIYRALEDAKARSRYDLTERYTSQLSELVKTTSYTETIAQLRSKIKL